MAKVKITVTRKDENGVTRSFVRIDERVLPFENGKTTLDIMVDANRRYPVTVYCEGPLGAKTTVSIEKANPPFAPLTAEIEYEGTVAPGYGSFRVTVP